MTKTDKYVEQIMNAFKSEILAAAMKSLGNEEFKVDEERCRKKVKITLLEYRKAK